MLQPLHMPELKMIGRPGVGRLGAAQRTGDAIVGYSLDRTISTLDTAQSAAAQCCLSRLDVIHITQFCRRKEQEQDAAE